MPLGPRGAQSLLLICAPGREASIPSPVNPGRFNQSRESIYYAAHLNTQNSTTFFVCYAVVILLDHLHSIWTLPQADADFSIRWNVLNLKTLVDVRGCFIWDMKDKRKEVEKAHEIRIYAENIKNPYLVLNNRKIKECAYYLG
jgi:hypothetical protein